MATWDDVRRLALRLPQTEEQTSRDGLPAWRVKDKSFAWERPLRLDRIPLDELEELLVEAWLCRAPKRLAAGYLDSTAREAGSG